MTTPKTDRIPGRAGSELPPRDPRGLSRQQGHAVRDLRGRLCGDRVRRSRPRHDSDREFGRRARRRHPPSDAGFQAAHRGRAFHAGAASAARAQGRDARGHQDGREPRACARPVPQGDPPARHQADRRRRHCGLGARDRRSRRQDARRHRHPPRRRDLRARYPAEDIEDESHNTTRFIVLAREARWAKRGDGPTVTTFLFRVRNVPAALYKTLGGFATNGVNMTKLESYMIEGNFFATQFYADVEGHPEDRTSCWHSRSCRSFQGNEDSRRLSGAPVPRDVRGSGGLSVTASTRRHGSVGSR